MSDWKQQIEAQIAELQHEGWYATQDTEAGAIATTLQAMLDEIERNRKEIDGLIELLRQERFDDAITCGLRWTRLNRMAQGFIVRETLKDD